MTGASRRSATPSTDVQFRASAYGKSGTEQFLRDVNALANAGVEGARYIVTGVEFDRKGRKHIHGVDADDFSGKPAYTSLVNEHIEPPLRIRYESVVVDGKRVGVFEIGDCQDRPYMMRVDFSETLRRGDAYGRVNDSMVKLGRRQLVSLFEKKFRDSVSAANVEVGFPGDIIYKDLRVRTRSLDKLPSVAASAKLARLFGTDSPYEERSTDEIEAEMRQLARQYQRHDNHFLFEQNMSLVQIVVLNQGEEPLLDASLALVMPNPEGFHVARELPPVPRDGEFIGRTASEQAGYPAVSTLEKSIQVSAKLGDVEPGEPVEAFELPLRICAGKEMAGRRVGLQYKLHAQNLRAPAAGKLRLLF